MHAFLYRSFVPPKKLASAEMMRRQKNHVSGRGPDRQPERKEGSINLLDQVEQR